MCNWKAFPIGGEDGVFKLRASFSGIDGIKLEQGENNTIPYITRQEQNNGIKSFVDVQKAVKDRGNVIIIGLDTQTVFYQPSDFYTGQNVQVLENKNLNKSVALFLIPLIKAQVSKLNWGGNGATLGRLSRMQIMLPIDKKEQPDYVYMEQHVKDIIYKEKVIKYIAYAKKQANSIVEKEIVSLENKEWSDFFITDIFPEVKRGKRLTKANQIEGLVPYVSSTAMNNGVDNFIKINSMMRKYDNCLSLANSGSVGSCFYEPFEYVASDHVTHLKNKDYSQYIYMFIAAMIKRLSGKYNFNREINDKRINREKVVLPIDENGNPDFEYMEQYMKNLIKRKYNKYIDYIGAKK